MLESEHFFDPWLTLQNRFVEALSDNLAGALAEHSPPRQRQQKERDRETQRTLIFTIAANLAYAVKGGFEPPVIAVPMAKPKAKRSRYERPGFRSLPIVLERLDASGLLILRKSRERGRVSTIEPATWLTGELHRFRFGLDNFGRAEGEETIILSRAETDHVSGIRVSDRKEYDDNATTIRSRIELNRINQALATADLRFERAKSDIDISQRKLRRVFNIPHWMRENTVRFDLGGRLYGGWWQNLKESDRAFIRIDGEPVIDLDFRSMFPYLAYIRTRKPIPSGDPYAFPGFGNYRDGVKRTFNAMLFRKGKLTRVPRGSRELLPPNCTGEKIRAAIFAHHPSLRPHFEKGIGFELMFLESQILVAVLLRLIDLGITALPMHDGLMVTESKARTASRVMGDVSEELTGHRLPVSRKL